MMTTGQLFPELPPDAVRCTAAPALLGIRLARVARGRIRAMVPSLSRCARSCPIYEEASAWNTGIPEATLSLKF
jgi:hypothetical protein